jgi:hypothetical protein
VRSGAFVDQLARAPLDGDSAGVATEAARTRQDTAILTGVESVAKSFTVTSTVSRLPNCDPTVANLKPARRSAALASAVQHGLANAPVLNFFRTLVGISYAVVYAPAGIWG